MKTKFVLPKHTNFRGFSCGNTTRIIWRTIGGKKVAKCAVCERQLKPQTFEEVLASHRFPIDGTVPRGPVGLIRRKANGNLKGNYFISKGCGNGSICGSCWRCN